VEVHPPPPPGHNKKEKDLSRQVVVSLEVLLILDITIPTVV
jgi:hypothetical protein